MIKPLLSGYKRQWTKCKKCGNVAYYDYIPYSLSNPIMALPCHHTGPGRFELYVDFISEDEAVIALNSKDIWIYA